MNDPRLPTIVIDEHRLGNGRFVLCAAHYAQGWPNIFELLECMQETAEATLSVGRLFSQS